MPIFLPVALADGSASTPIHTDPIVVMQLAEYFAEEGGVFIGGHLMTDREIDELVTRVIADAESFRRLAKHELDLAKTRSRKP